MSMSDYNPGKQRVEIQKKSGDRDERGVRVAKFNTKGHKPTEPNLSEENMTALEMMIADFLPKLVSPNPHYDTPEQLQDAIKEYFLYIVDCNRNGAKLVPDIEGLCSYIGVGRRQFNYWEQENQKGFAPTITKAKNFIAAYKKQLGFKGEIPPIIFATDFNNNHDYINPKNQIEITTRPVEFIDKEALIREALSMPVESPMIEDKAQKEDPTN